MKVLKSLCLAAALTLAGALAVGALTPEEVIKLKKAGVSDATIQKMLEQEQASGGGQQGPVVDAKKATIYQAGEDGAAEERRYQADQRRQEERNDRMLKNVIIDQRNQQGNGQ